MPVLSSSSVEQSPAASTARPRQREHVAAARAGPCRRSRSPRAARRSWSGSGRRAAPRARSPSCSAPRVDRERLQRHDREQEDRSSARRAGCRARSRSASSAATAPSTSAIIRSRKLSPGFGVTRTTIWSESTRVPPVTAERSPPDSRITGADSPVIADSSTLRDPLDHVAVGRDHLAGRDDDDVAGRELGSGTSSIVPSARRRRATVSARVLRSASACALPRPSATASAKLANSDREPEPDRDQPRRRRSDRRSRCRSTSDAAPTSTTNITGLRAIRARIELADAVDARPAQRSRGRGGTARCASQAELLHDRARARGRGST